MGGGKGGVVSGREFLLWDDWDGQRHTCRLRVCGRAIQWCKAANNTYLRSGRCQRGPRKEEAAASEQEHEVGDDVQHRGHIAPPQGTCAALIKREDGCGEANTCQPDYRLKCGQRCLCDCGPVHRLHNTHEQAR